MRRDSGRVAAAAPRARARPERKRPGQYHHGNLHRAMLDEALQTIQRQGVEQLTLRGVGASLGVSRTALYRHFSDKQALLAAVAREGFRMLRRSLLEALDGHCRGTRGFEAMGSAYVRFAVAHPSYYRVMFGGFLDSCSRDPGLIEDAKAAFQVLVDSLVEQQQSGLVRRDDPVLLARFVWSVVHGIAMLAIDGQLGPTDPLAEALNQYAAGRLRDALVATPDSSS